MNGDPIDTDWTGTLATGSVVLTDVNTDVAAEGTQEAIDEVKAKLESGEVHVFDCSTFTVDGQFAESTFRSAPYFQLQIDGINLLDTNFG